MTVTVATWRLVELLTDALQTADLKLSQELGLGIHVGTTRGHWQRPGEVDLLSMTSTTRFITGHTWSPCDGQMPASVWPVDSARNVLAIAKTLAAKGNSEQNTTIDILLERAPIVDGKTADGEHPGWIVTVRETPALFDSSTEFQFHAWPESRFPVVAMAKALTGGEGKVPADDQPKFNVGPLTAWNPLILRPIVAVSRRRKESILMYRYPGRAAHLVQIGDSWLGAAMCATPDPEWQVDGPSILAVLTAEAEQ